MVTVINAYGTFEYGPTELEQKVVELSFEWGISIDDLSPVIMHNQSYLERKSNIPDGSIEYKRVLKADFHKKEMGLRKDDYNLSLEQIMKSLAPDMYKGEIKYEEAKIKKGDHEFVIKIRYEEKGNNVSISYIDRKLDAIVEGINAQKIRGPGKSFIGEEKWVRRIYSKEKGPSKIENAFNVVNQYLKSN